jgi:DNA-directed RNA polymerase specialized sigma24 family protein
MRISLLPPRGLVRLQHRFSFFLTSAEVFMSSSGSVTYWLAQLKAGDRAGAQEIWLRYVRRLVGLARKKLQGEAPRLADEEDVALSAFQSFCQCAEQGRFAKLDDRDDLWQVLVLLTARKATALRRHESRQKRGGHKAFDSEPDLDGIIAPEPTPAFAAQLAEEVRLLLAKLPDEQLRNVTVWKMEGYTNEEIAGKLGCVVRTVDRKLWAIRRLCKDDDVS